MYNDNFQVREFTKRSKNYDAELPVLYANVKVNRKLLSEMIVLTILK
jgi:hypothetical protein